MNEAITDVLVIGGGLGGVAAALTAARLGYRVTITEETDWLGGQLTSQAVPTDEHPWIESFGSTESYRALRENIRDYYRRYYPLTSAARSDRYFNPGASLVSRIGCEPRVVVAVLDAMLAPHRANGRITVLLQHKPVAAEVQGDRVTSVTVQRIDGERVTLTAPYILDATELGDLLPLANVEYVTGAESQAQTGEPHALPEADPLRMQGITFCFAAGYRLGEDHTIDKPASYDFWRTYQAEFETGPHLSLNPRPSIDYQFFPDPAVKKFSLWQFRRILYKGNFAPGFLDSDVTIFNCTQNDYWLGPIIEVPAEEAQHHLTRAKELSLSLLYWLQTEAPRPDGGVGYPGLRLRSDVVDTADGLAKHPYIRESRRMRTEFTVVEQHVTGQEADLPPISFADSVGIGSYMVDIHASVPGIRSHLGYHVSRPFEIPLGALIPLRMENLLPACKNLGVTHITNGCFRLHPVEWGVGEAAGALAAFCLARETTPRQVRNTAGHLADFQQLLTHLGVELHWPHPTNGMSYYRWASQQPDWTWGETDRPIWSHLSVKGGAMAL
jgi:hypothetical protein